MFDFANFVLQLGKERREFIKRNEPKKYIELLEDKLDEIVENYNELLQENKKLNLEIKKDNGSEFDEYQLEMLKFAVEREEIGDYYLDDLFKKSPKYRIAFQQLSDSNILLYLGYYQAPHRTRGIGNRYVITDDKMSQVLSALSKANML